MPFKSKSQMRACFAKKDKDWNCHEWAEHTPDTKALPEKAATFGAMLGKIAAYMKTGCNQSKMRKKRVDK